MTPAASPERPAFGEGALHDHAWGRMRFELVDDRPMVRQTCELCGLVRGYRAWDRSWTPGQAEIRR